MFSFNNPFQLGPPLNKRQKTIPQKQSETSPKATVGKQEKKTAADGSEDDLDDLYHAGDLGFGTDTAMQRIDASRQTGHLGTGVYFCAGEKGKQRVEKYDPWKIKGYVRPIYKVSFKKIQEKYKLNLYRPRDLGHAKALHGTFRNLNGLLTLYEREEKGDEWYKVWYDDKLKECVDWLFDKELEEVFKKQGIEKEDFKDTITNSLILEMKENKETIAKKEKENSKFSYPYVFYYDSLSTLVMKKLGFDGIDMRHIDNFNTCDYGTLRLKSNISKNRNFYPTP